MRTRPCVLACLVALTLSTNTTSAQQPADAGAPGFTLTVYSSADPASFDPMIAPRSSYDEDNYGYGALPGFGVVREIRPIELKAGENTLRFTGVAAGIDPTTVSFEPLGADTGGAAVLEQNFEYDLIGADKLLQGHVGRDVILALRPPSPQRDDEGRPAPAPDGPSLGTARGKLLSSNRDTIIIETGDKQTPVQLINRTSVASIALSGRDSALVTEPTLVWKLHADKAVKQDARVSYQTDGLTWRADYRVTVNADQTRADLNAWVSLVNESGIGYPDAKLKLIAGDVRRSPRMRQQRAGGGLFGDSGGNNKGFEEKAFFEYHLYTLGRPSSVPNNATKQIELFPPRKDVPVAMTYVYFGSADHRWWWDDDRRDENRGDDFNKKVDVYIDLTNSKANGLGLPLPAGRVRAYKRDDADGVEEFVGEDVIDHTPTDERLALRIGTAFDIVGEWRKSDENLNQFERFRIASYEIKVRNHKPQAVRVLVREDITYRDAKWEITEASAKWEKRDADTIIFPVDVPAGGEATVTYTVKQTW